jgi:glyoxylase I family protein
LAAWHSEVFGIGQPPDIWQQTAGPTVFAPFALDTDYFGSHERQFMVDLRVHDLDAMIAALEAAGIAVETRAEGNSEAGCFARVHDPGGNPVELWEPPGGA